MRLSKVVDSPATTSVVSLKNAFDNACNKVAAVGPVVAVVGDDLVAVVADAVAVAVTASNPLFDEHPIVSRSADG